MKSIGKIFFLAWLLMGMPVAAVASWSAAVTDSAWYLALAIPVSIIVFFVFCAIADLVIDYSDGRLKESSPPLS